MAFTPDTSSIKSPGDAGLPPNLDSGSGGNLSDMIAKLMQPSAEEKSATKAREQATTAATDALKNRSKDEAATTAELEKNMPKPEDFGLGKDELKAMEPGKSPSYKPDDPLQNFGGIATLIGVFGGMLTRHPVIASLNAASGAMKAAHERNIEDYEKQVEEWKNNQDYIGKVLAWREQMYGAADKKFANDLAARQAARTEIASRTQDAMTLEQITAGDEQRYYQTRQDSARLLQQMKENNERLKISSDELAERIRHDQKEEQKPTGGATQGWQVLTDPANQKQYRYNAASGQAKDLTTDEPYTPSGAAKLAGGTPRSAPAMFLQKYMQEHPGATAEEIGNAAAGYGARVKAVSAFATGKQGDIVRSFDVATQHVDTLDKLTDALNNGDFKAFNAIAQRWAKETGNPAPTNFETARNIIGNEIVKAIVGAAGTGEDRDRAQAAFQSANSPQTLKGATETVRRLMGGQLVGIEKQFVDTTGQTEADFEKRLTPGALKVLKTALGDQSGGHDAAPTQKAMLNNRQIEVKDGKWIFSDTKEAVPQ